MRAPSHPLRRRASRARCAWLAGVCALLLGTTSNATPIQLAPEPEWADSLTALLAKADHSYPGELGVYVKDLQSGAEYSYKAEEPWYLASMVKVPVAIAVMRAVERAELSLDQTVTLSTSDYVDGTGQTNQHGPGERLSIDWLMHQMLVYSDNTATDMLIGQLGLQAVNDVTKELVPDGFEPITTLAEVRRQVYGHYHPAAANLVGRQFLTLKQQRTEAERRAALARLLKVAPSELASIRYDDAYAQYYASGLNSAPLTAYGHLLERLARGEALKPDSTAYVLGVMGKVATGSKRLKAGLPDTVSLAHKTGTQRGRFCDAGIAQARDGDQSRTVIIAACTRGSLSLDRSEQALSHVGRAVGQSGLFSQPLRLGRVTP